MQIKLDIPNFQEYTLHEAALKLKEKQGVYCLYSEDDNELLYIGKTSDISSRLNSHLRYDKRWFIYPIHHIKVCFFDCKADMDIYETYLINLWKPHFNINKVYTYKTMELKEIKIGYQKREVVLPLCENEDKPITPLVFCDYLCHAIDTSPMRRVHRTSVTNDLTKAGYFPYPPVNERSFKEFMIDRNIEYVSNYFKYSE